MPYHNPVNTALGLLEELEGAERADRAETVADVRSQLPDVADAIDALAARQLNDEESRLRAQVRSRLADALAAGGSQPEGPPSADGGDAKRETTKPARKPRTTAAPAAPERTVPPAAK